MATRRLNGFRLGRRCTRGFEKNVLFVLRIINPTPEICKEIGDLCDINKTLTFHLARHTFVTTTTAAKSLPIETVSKMLGHTHIATTQIYTRITSTKIKDNMKVLAQKLRAVEVAGNAIDLYRLVDVL
jgi:integrase